MTLSLLVPTTDQTMFSLGFVHFCGLNCTCLLSWFSNIPDTLIQRLFQIPVFIFGARALWKGGWISNKTSGLLSRFKFRFQIHISAPSRLWCLNHNNYIAVCNDSPCCPCSKCCFNHVEECSCHRCSAVATSFQLCAFPPYSAGHDT